MDLWVVAAAAGAGYFAKYWQNLPREREGLSESFAGDSIHGQFESQNLLQQIRDQTSQFHRLARKQLGRDGSSDREDGRFSEINQLGGDSETGLASTSGGGGEGLANVGKCEDYNVLSLTSLLPGFCERDSFQENGDGIKGKGQFYDKAGVLLPEFSTGEASYLNRFSRNRSLRSRRSHGHSVKPLNSLESCLTAQLYRNHAKMEEYVFSLLPSPSTPTVRPLLVTDGSRIISRASSDSFGVQFDSGESNLQGEDGARFEENEALLGAPLKKNGSVELPRKPKQMCGNERFGRLNSSSTRVAGGPFPSQGSPNGMLLFFLGITIGIMSSVLANKREVDKLNELLKQTENLVQDLHEELELKDLLIVKELSNEGYESQETNKHSFLNGKPTAFSTEQELDESTKNDGKEPYDRKAENSETMRKIEAELEAELERLELNMKTSSLERLSDVVELDPDFVADVVQGELRLDTVNGQPGGPSDSDSDASGTSTHLTHTANYAVSPQELSLRLHEVIQSKLEARIMELETALQNSQRKVHSMELECIISRRGLSYSEVGSSSTQETPTFVDECNDIDQPLVINLSGEALDAYNEAYEEIVRMTKTDQETPPNSLYDSRHIMKELPPFDKKLFEGRNGEDNGSISHHDTIEERWLRSLVRDKIRTWEEQTSRSCGSNEVGESEDDDEIGKFLIKQIVERTRQGSSVVLNAQQRLNTKDDQQILE